MERIWGCSVANQALSNRTQGKPVQFPGALGIDIPFSPLYTAQVREQHAYYGFEGLLYLLASCRLGLFLAYCAKGSNRSNFHQGGPGGKLHHICVERANMLPSFSSFLPDSVLPPEFWIIFFVLILYHPKEFQFFRCLQLSRILGMSSESSTMSLVACVAGQRAGGFGRSWQFAKRAARGGCSSSLAGGQFEMFTPDDFLDWEVEQFADALVLRSLRAVLGVWRLPAWGQADDVNAECFSLLGSWSIKTRIPQRTHTQLYGTMCGFLDFIHQVGAPPSQWAELDVPLEAAVRDGDVILADDHEANKAWCVDRQELFLYLTSQLLQDKHTWAHRPGLQERDGCILLLTESFLGLLGWIRAGSRGVGDIRPACLFPLVKCKCFLDSGVRRCCKVVHSCMRRVVDCSSTPHKMAWRSVARAIRTVARLGGPGCEIFDISLLRFELDSMFQELDTPLSRCCWRCGCAMSCVIV